MLVHFQKLVQEKDATLLQYRNKLAEMRQEHTPIISDESETLLAEHQLQLQSLIQKNIIEGRLAAMARRAFETEIAMRDIDMDILKVF